MDQVETWMVLKSSTLVPSKLQGLARVTMYRVANYCLSGEEVVGKGLTEEEAQALVKLLS